jgi:hypothetical protein
MPFLIIMVSMQQIGLALLAAGPIIYKPHGQFVCARRVDKIT